MPTLKDVEFQIARLRLKKGDILAIKVHEPIHEEIRIAILESLREVLANAGHSEVQTLYVDHDIDIGIILFEPRSGRLAAPKEELQHSSESL